MRIFKEGRNWEDKKNKKALERKEESKNNMPRRTGDLLRHPKIANLLELTRALLCQ